MFGKEQLAIAETNARVEKTKKSAAKTPARNLFTDKSKGGKE